MEKLEVVSSIFLFEKEKIIALEDRVVVEYSSLTKEYRVEFKYSDLKPRVVRGRSGDSSWTTIGNNLLTTAFGIAFASLFIFRVFLELPYFRVVLFGIAALGLVAYCLRLVKYDKVWIDEKDGSSGLFIKLTKQNRGDAEKLISYVAQKLNQVEATTTSSSFHQTEKQ